MSGFRGKVPTLLLMVGAVVSVWGQTSQASGTNVRFLSASGDGGKQATFLMRKIAPRTIASARMRVGRHIRRVGLAAARAGARRGVLHVNLSPRLEQVLQTGKSQAQLILSLTPIQAHNRTLYASTSPWNQRIPPAPEIDPSSRAMVAGLSEAQAEKGFPIAVENWTVPVYFTNSSTPRYAVTLRKAPPQWTDAYGTPPNFIAAPPGWLTDPAVWSPRTGPARTTDPMVLRDVPIPEGAQPDPELDGHMTVIDGTSGCEYDLYAAHRDDGGWTAVWGNSTRIHGSGVYPQGLSSKASGFAGAAGLIFPEELRSGRIDHALFMAFPFTKAGGPVPPATSSDGLTIGEHAIPIGARVQLDPDLDLDKLELKPYEHTVARALQQYGMIVGDTGGALSLYAVNSQSYPSNPYTGLLPDAPYAYLDHIPVNHFRVIKLSPQRMSLSLGIQNDGCSKPG